MKHNCKILCAVTTLAATLSMLSCIDGNNKKNGSDKDSDSLQVILIDSIAVPGMHDAVGTIGDGTSMNVLELITDQGDTIAITCPANMVAGGVNVGDRIAVTYNSTNGGNSAMTSINLTSLQHLWTQQAADGHEQSLELDEGGRATTYDMAIEYNSWSLEDGKLLLHSPKKIASESAAIADTFEIMELNDERLVLMHGNLTTEFSKDN